MLCMLHETPEHSPQSEQELLLLYDYLSEIAIRDTSRPGEQHFRNYFYAWNSVPFDNVSAYSVSSIELGSEVGPAIRPTVYIDWRGTNRSKLTLTNAPGNRIEHNLFSTDPTEEKRPDDQRLEIALGFIAYLSTCLAPYRITSLDEYRQIRANNHKHPIERGN